MSNARWWSSLVAVTFLGGVVGASAAPMPYTVGTAAGGGFTLGGHVIARSQVTLSAQAGGRVQFVIGGAGTQVHPGQTLIALDPGPLAAQRAQAIAQFHAAQAGAYNSRAQYGYQMQSYNPMFSFFNPFAWAGTGMSAMMGQGQHNPWTSYLSGIDNRRAGVMTAYADMQAASARIGQIDAELRDTLAISPFDGVVLSKQVDPGDTVQPGQPLITLASDGGRQVVVMVPDQMAANIRLGQEMAVSAPNEAALTASVAQVAPQADPQTHTLRIKLDLPAGEGPRLGSYVQVAIPASGARNETPVIPRSALLGGRSLPSVLVLHKGIGELRVLRLGEPLPGDQVQVLSGLKAGETIVNDPPPGAGYGYKMGDEGSSTSAAGGA